MATGYKFYPKEEPKQDPSPKKSMNKKPEKQEEPVEAMTVNHFIIFSYENPNELQSDIKILGDRCTLLS